MLKLSAHSSNFNRATNMLNGHIKHNVTIFLSSYFTVVIRRFFALSRSSVCGIYSSLLAVWQLWLLLEVECLANLIRDDNSWMKFALWNSELFVLRERALKQQAHTYRSTTTIPRKVLIFVSLTQNVDDFKTVCSFLLFSSLHTHFSLNLTTHATAYTFAYFFHLIPLCIYNFPF